MSEYTVKSLAVETHNIEQQMGQLLLKSDENKSKIQKYFDENQIKELEIAVGEKNTFNIKSGLVIKKSERATLTYKIEELKKKFDDEMFLEITKRSYVITDIDAMIKMVREAGVSAKQFKQYLEVVVKADSARIKQMYDSKEITMKQLNGTFTATISKTIKITEAGGKN